MKSVAILLFPDVLMLDVAGPIEVFSIANRYLAPADHYRISTISIAEPGVRASNGLRLLTDHVLADAPEAFDLLLVPGGPNAYNESHPALLPWLRRATQASRRYGSICTGAFILGEAGLLDGRQVTTHWNYTERLARRFPAARVITDRIFIADGELITSGGITAGIDMALAILADDHGKKLAVDVAKVLLVAMKRQGGQAQFSPMLAEVAREDSPIARAQQYIFDRLEEELSVDVLAEVAGMSARHFSRLFARDTGKTPMEFVHAARIDRARNLLETTDLPLKTVAYRSGFRSVRCMRILFSERLGLSPAQYRHQFG
ncbi:GlxA family transcriptional regulator [Pseudomonas indica]|uniref:Transcriptional regulator GlxA family, contains an amidase domain and an AraC-type DNA-binding HTH domain n=1 Tax=Pseudomonas indica TaxID=137658 RepID=A0A1G9BYY6_9PSED|nr:GlxA family transcriptional regulator [Pseudomonas indica]SDK44364.1 Transcriptional regulator GlxA family, contains an amidase domain and an AraC-type DNA-binding HTH domain [Pseudomonas indica]